ncbi:histidine phosphatase family protein [Streptomyces sp. NPDC026589]|uniref:histidine phosphatase family protein n=1 Tax=Streptomyces sp. NPDC026589 TaxID=3155609 RepID=UPI0033E1D302
MRLLLVRHGENPANVHHILSFRKADFRLTARGREQAVRLRATLALGPETRYWASPLRRARHTARLLAPYGTAIGIMEELRELDVGLLDGSGKAVDRRAYYQVIGAWRSGRVQTRFPGGEDLVNAMARLRFALRHIVSSTPEDTAVVVGHGGLFTEGLLRLLDPAGRHAFQAACDPRWLNCEAAEFCAGCDGADEVNLTWRAWLGRTQDAAATPPRDSGAADE